MSLNDNSIGQGSSGQIDSDSSYDFEPHNKQEIEKAEHDHEVRKRIDDLLEKKRLKELLDDSDDW